MLAPAIAAVATAVLAGPASGQAVSESTARDIETELLGPAHALEHAIERRSQRRASERWRALSPAQRARILRARQRLLEAANLRPASSVGRWTAPFSLPVHAINTVVLPTGKVMFWAYPFRVTDSAALTIESHAYIWDPSKGTGTGAFHEASPPADDQSDHAMIFCGGQSLLPDGSVLTTGGNLYVGDNPARAGLKDVWRFDPWDETWTRQPDTAQGRWYPTQTELPDGRTLILGGLHERATGLNNDLEVFTASADPHGVGSVDLFQSGERDTGLYPRLYTMPTGQVLLAGQRSQDNALLTVAHDGADVFEWSETSPSDPRTGGNAILEPGGPAGSTRVTLIGGDDPAAYDAVAKHTPSRATTQTLDVDRLGDGWQPSASMNIPRSNFNTVVLPDGSVAAIGGSNGQSAAEGLYTTWDDNRSRQLELRDPATGQWRLGPAQKEDRAYHSTAVLLPDGRVFSGGDDRPGMRTSDTAEIYSPPYLFHGPRPRIGSAPSQLRYGEAFRVGARFPWRSRFPIGGDSNAARAVLMAPGATTHGDDMQARHVELAVTSQDRSGLDAIAPPSAAVAPPGWYMLFLLSRDGVPSVARWVHLDN